MRLTLIALTLFVGIICFGKTVNFPESTPVFASNFVDFEKDQPILILPQAHAFEVIDEVTGYISKHPLMRKEHFFVIKLPNGTQGFIAENVTAKTPFAMPTQSLADWVGYLQVICAATFFILLWICFKLCKSGKMSLNSPWGITMITLIVISLRQFLFLVFQSQVGNFLCSPADDTHYYATAVGMMSGSFSGQWLYTIGLGLWYIPFMHVLDANSYYDIAEAFSYFSALIIAPATLGLLFLLFVKMTKRPIVSLIAVVILAILPFIHHWTYIDDANHSISFFAMPDYGGTFFNYNSFIFAGFNTMSDTPSLFVLVLLFFLAAYLPTRWYTPLVLGVIAGGACLLRINMVWLLPAVGILYVLRLDKPWKQREVLSYLGGVVGALAIFSIQFYVNYKQFGDIFTFPYVLHPNRAAEGFVWEFLPINIPFLVEANRGVWTVAVVALWFIKERNLRIILCFWALPCIIFFFGYTCTTYDAVRFVLPTFPALILLALLPRFWQEKFDRRHTFLAIYTIAGAVLLNSTTPWYFQVAILALGAYLIYLFKDKKSILIYIALLALIFFVPGAWLIAILIVAAMGYAAYELIVRLTTSTL